MLVRLRISSPFTRNTVDFEISEDSTIQDFVDITRDMVLKNFEYAQYFAKSDLGATMNGISILGDYKFDTQICKLFMWEPNCCINAVATFYANEVQRIPLPL